MHDLPYIFKLTPNRVWRTYRGGKFLDIIEGKSKPKDSHFPEDWIGSVTRAENTGRERFSNEGLSTITLSKPINGRNRYFFNDLLKLNPVFFLGKRHLKQFGVNTFFLLKFLDSAERLHIQVHPSPSFSQKHLGIRAGKTEGYYILATRNENKDHFIYMGFKENINRDTFRRLVEKQDSEAMLSLLNKIYVKKNDSFFIPGGIPHAIGSGIFLIEAMEPTDFVARFEFKIGNYTLPYKSRFMGRDMNFALDMMRFKSITPKELKQSFFVKQIGNHLIDQRYTNCFAINSYRVQKETYINENSFFIALVISGNGIIKSGSVNVAAKKWDRFFIPHAEREIKIIPDKEMHIMTILPPKI